MTLYDKAKLAMKPGQGYTRKELRVNICASQSSTADYIIADMIASGVIHEIAPKDGINRTYRLTT